MRSGDEGQDDGKNVEDGEDDKIGDFGEDDGEDGEDGEDGDDGEDEKDDEQGVVLPAAEKWRPRLSLFFATLDIGNFNVFLVREGNLKEEKKQNRFQFSPFNI